MVSRCTQTERKATTTSAFGSARQPTSSPTPSSSQGRAEEYVPQPLHQNSDHHIPKYVPTPTRRPPIGEYLELRRLLKRAQYVQREKDKELEHAITF